MAEKTLHIEVQEDYLERIAQTKKPILAVSPPVKVLGLTSCSQATVSLESILIHHTAD